MSFSRLWRPQLYPNCHCQHTTSRGFSTLPPLQIQRRDRRPPTKSSVKQQIGTTDPKTRRSHLADFLPYPYGPRQWYKQSNRGLYGGLSVGFGNRVSEKNEHKNRRQWHPNIQKKKLYSQALGRSIKVKVATRVLRTIDKLGGLDEYLLGDKPARIKELGPTGWMLRWRIMQTPAIKERFRQQRIALGLPEQGIGDVGLIDMFGKPITVEEALQDVTGIDQKLDEMEEEPDEMEEELDEPDSPGSDADFDAEQTPRNRERIEEPDPILLHEEPAPRKRSLTDRLFGRR